MAKLKSMINKDKYQVFLLSSKIPVPFNMFIHTWFVVNIKGKIHRIEFGKFYFKSQQKFVSGLFTDLFSIDEGLNILLFTNKFRFNSKLIGFVEGDSGSVAEKMSKFIIKHSDEFSEKYRYFWFGPNCNTYTQWVINNFPECDLKLPLNAIGRGFRL